MTERKFTPLAPANGDIPSGTSRELRFKEILPSKPEREISAESLMANNLSDKCHEMMVEWDITRIDGEHIVTIGCGDSRKRLPLKIKAYPRTENVQSIATGGPKHPYESLFKSRNNRAIVNLTHLDGDTVFPEQIPGGCGGEDAKAALETNGRPGNEGIYDFIEYDIDHKDTIVQSCRSALKIFELSGKPVMAATQDHLTGIIHPVLALWDSKNTRHQITNRLVTLEDLMATAEYNPKKIYQEGLPCLDIEDLPEMFRDYLAANREEMNRLYKDYPDYRRMVKTQNPPTLFLTTDVRPIHAKFPDSFDAPGSFFRLTIPRRKYTSGDDDLSIDIPTEELERVFNQTEYPISHFNKLSNIIIETPSLDLSESTAKSLLGKEWMGEWKQKPNAQIIAVESRGGKIINMSTFSS